MRIPRKIFILTKIAEARSKALEACLKGEHVDQSLVRELAKSACSTWEDVAGEWQQLTWKNRRKKDKDFGFTWHGSGKSVHPPSKEE